MFIKSFLNTTLILACWQLQQKRWRIRWLCNSIEILVGNVCWLHFHGCLLYKKWHSLLAIPMSTNANISYLCTIQYIHIFINVEFFLPLNLDIQYFFHEDISMHKLFRRHRIWTAPLKILFLLINGRIAKEMMRQLAWSVTSGATRPFLFTSFLFSQLDLYIYIYIYLKG